jgi:Fic-DOC domain mobile mystery protein B
VSGLFEADDNATPLAPEERDGLIPAHVTLRHELNELEQLNILEADQWAFQRKRGVLGEPFLRGLHRRMFYRVWSWAGQYRTTERNFGLPYYRILPEMMQIIDDARYWIDHGSFPPDEIAVRLHHRLVFVHPFPNGNGRWSRMAADLLAVQLGRPRFTWGSSNLQPVSELRRSYIDALHAADNHDIAPLVAFARS